MAISIAIVFIRSRTIFDTYAKNKNIITQILAQGIKTIIRTKILQQLSNSYLKYYPFG